MFAKQEYFHDFLRENDKCQFPSFVTGFVNKKYVYNSLNNTSVNLVFRDFTVLKLVNAICKYHKFLRKVLTVFNIFKTFGISLKNSFDEG